MCIYIYIWLFLSLQETFRLRYILHFRARWGQRRAAEEYGTYIHTYIHTYMHAYIHTRLARRWICPCKRLSAYGTYIHTYMHACILGWRGDGLSRQRGPLRLRRGLARNIYIYIYIYIYMCVCIYIYIYIYICVCFYHSLIYVYIYIYI